MRFKKIALTALACGLLTLFSGCSDKDNSSSESSSQLDTTSVSTVTSIVTVTDDNGVNVTDDNGNNVTSVVTVVSKADESSSTTNVSYVTSVSETIVTSNVTVTDSEGSAVTDAKGESVTSIVTSVSEVIVTVPVTTTAARTTTTKKSTTAKATAATTTAITTVTTADNSNVTTTTAVTTVSNTTTSSTAQTENDVILSFSDIDFPTAGECFGTVSIPTVNIQMDLYMGDTNQILRKGIGMYYGSYLPGYEGRTIMCGHNSAGYLADWVDYAKANDVVGERIIVNTTYGDYVYEIYETAVLNSSDTRYFTNSYSDSTLILYSCMESDYTDERLYFVAKKLSGPVLIQ